jgi:hypothetical protein
MVYLGMEPLSKFSIMQSIFKSASRRKTLESVVAAMAVQRWLD